MVTSQDWGGAQAYIFNLAKEMKDRDLPVKVCAGGKGELGEKCRKAGVEFIGLKRMARDINPVNNLLSLFELIALFKREKPSVIHLNSSMMGVVGSLAGKIAKVPRIVYVAHGWVFNEILPAWKKDFYVWIEKISAGWKHVIICINPKDESLALSMSIKPKEKILTIPNGLDVTAHENNLMDRHAAREKLGLAPHSIVVGTVANAYPPKNLSWYLDVCRKTHEKNPLINFVIIGDGPLMPELKRKHAELKQEDYVKLAGRRLDAPNLLRAFDVFVLPSTKEGMSITLLEAMASRVPCVATDVGANRLTLGQNGMIVNANDDQAMVKAILDLTNNQKLREDLAEKAYRDIKERFDWKRSSDETIKTLCQ
jgi:glycosyltransferase involved in cell wall biosynthesis